MINSLIIKTKQIIINLISKYHLSNFITKLLINLKLYNLLLPHDIDFYALQHFKKYIGNKDIIDVGGHFGLATLNFRYLNYKENFIHIFEPNIETHKYIKKIMDNKMKLYALGLSNKISNSILFTPKKKIKHTSRSTLELSNLSDFKTIKNIKYIKKKIKISKLDKINIKNDIGFIKIDIEGHEYMALLGMIKKINKNNPIIMLEANKNYFEKIKKLFKKNYIAMEYNPLTDKFFKLKKMNYDARTYNNLKNFFLIPKKLFIKLSIL